MNAVDSRPLAASANVIAYPTFAEATATFARIGLLSFGGPAGQIALMHRVLVEEKRWISEERFLHALNYCMLLPGPEAQQLATYIGWLLHGWRGGVVAGLLFILPGFFVILALSAFYVLFQGSPILDSIFFGLKAAVLAIVIDAVLRIGRRALKNRFLIALAVAAFIAIFALRAPFPLIVLGAAAIGYVGAIWEPRLFQASVHAAQRIGGSFLELPDRAAAPGIGRAASVIAIWGAVWAAPVILIVATLGWDTVFTPIAKLFSLMAMITFGGAYAVLAYVAQEAVQRLAWLTPAEMLDGLALAETTPGPLILVLTFVGFVAAFRAPPGVDPLTSALLGATLTTWVTFVPCFLWIFLGAPYVERLRANKALSGALSTITAAVVGVIMNLAVWFGLHTLFRKVGVVNAGPISMPWPEFASLDPLAALLAAGAAVALFRFKTGLVGTLAGAAIAGLTLRWAVG